MKNLNEFCMYSSKKKFKAPAEIWQNQIFREMVNEVWLKITLKILQDLFSKWSV